MRLLVTGGAGYIGSIVAQQLLARGDDVTVLDSLYRGHRAAVPEGAAFVEADLLDPDALPAALAGFDGVVHFAALSLVGESVEFPERYWRGNVVGALNLLDAMRASGRQAARLLLDRRDLRRARRRPDHRGHADRAGQRVRQLEARDRPDAHRRGARARPGGGLAALLQRRRRERGAGRGPHPETHLIPLVLQAAAGKRESVAIFGTDYPTPDGTAVRDYIHVEDLGARTSSRSRRPSRAATTSSTSAPSAAIRCAR